MACACSVAATSPFTSNAGPRRRSARPYCAILPCGPEGGKYLILNGTGYHTVAEVRKLLINEGNRHLTRNPPPLPCRVGYDMACLRQLLLRQFGVFQSLFRV